MRVKSREFSRGTNQNGEIRAVAIHDLEGGHMMRRVHTVIEDEFSSEKEVDPVVVARVGEQLEVLLDFLVGAFGLTVGLGVVCSCEGTHDA
jgi:hypothetical protein